MTENNKPKMKLWKKILIGLFALIVIVKLFSGGNSSKENTSDKQVTAKQEEQVKEEDSKDEQVKEEKPKENKVLGIDDEWIVDGQWKLKILGVTPTDDRNEFSDKEPAQVVLVSYTYENLGYEDDIMDGLFLTPDQMIDEQGSVAYDYPANTTHHADEVPVGAKVDIAEQAYGLNNASKEVTVNFVKYDGNGQKQKVSFKVPVQ